MWAGFPGLLDAGLSHLFSFGKKLHVLFKSSTVANNFHQEYFADAYNYLSGLLIMWSVYFASTLKLTTSYSKAFQKHSLPVSVSIQLYYYYIEYIYSVQYQRMNGVESECIPLVCFICKQFQTLHLMQFENSTNIWFLSKECRSRCRCLHFRRRAGSL